MGSSSYSSAREIIIKWWTDVNVAAGVELVWTGPNIYFRIVMRTLCKDLYRKLCTYRATFLWDVNILWEEVLMIQKSGRICYLVLSSRITSRTSISQSLEGAISTQL